MMYLAAQYLAGAGISFLEKRKDDSHTNMEFRVEDATLHSRQLNKLGSTLSLNYNSFSLQWNTTNSETSIPLNGNTHSGILSWLKKSSEDAGFKKAYKYEFHYEPTYGITDDFKFALLDAGKLSQLMHLRILAELALEDFLQHNGLNSEIRVWPHHFDTGAFAIFQEKPDMAVGLGLAVPDTLVDDHYFYIRGYKDGNSIDPAGFSPLHQGYWQKKDFKGAILPAMNIDKAGALTFFQDAFEQLKWKSSS